MLSEISQYIPLIYVEASLIYFIIGVVLALIVNHFADAKELKEEDKELLKEHLFGMQLIIILIWPVIFLLTIFRKR